MCASSFKRVHTLGPDLFHAIGEEPTETPIEPCLEPVEAIENTEDSCYHWRSFLDV